MGDRDRAPAERTVTVRGLGVTRVRPDGVIVGLTVRHRAEAAAEALNVAARKAQVLEGLFREKGIQEEGWVADSISLQEWTEWDESSRNEVRKGYVASSRVVVRLVELEDAGSILAEAAERTEAMVDGPRWEIRPENPAHDEARRRAIADARHRAEVYADSAGLSLGDVVEVVEAGAEQPGRSMRGEYTALARSSAFEMPVHSEGLEIVAGVQVTYLLLTR